MTLKTLTASILLASFLLLTGCNDNAKTKTNSTTENNVTIEQNTTTAGSSDDNTTVGGEANDNGNTTAEGSDDNTTTPPITDLTSLKLTIEKSSLNKDEHTTVKIMATYSDNSIKELNTNIEWVITPTDGVDVNGSILTAKKDGTVTVQAKVGATLSNTLNLNITWVVNGHVLPPKPDPTINNSTLLGIDVNDNGVRDDVERYIYERFGKDPEYPKTKVAIAMQYAWATQKILETPVIESEKYLDDALGCESYWLDTKTLGLRYLDYRKFASKHEVFNDTSLKDIMLNTKERILEKFKFNKACSGNIFSGRQRSLQNCQIDISAFGE